MLVKAILIALILASCTTTKTNYELKEVCEHVTADRCEIRK